ncbi:hypothetical protein F0562_029710 [Nyssa sinensis]|uniref:Uncharacterized protein n=1 Tax=Nyssa sinensis TaxID=561372 RepID=A0A5J5B3U8_9ASTE|nr:hypothetical protein F0562_029710 [Nyssa sinensis]
MGIVLGGVRLLNQKQLNDDVAGQYMWFVEWERKLHDRRHHHLHPPSFLLSIFSLQRRELDGKAHHPNHHHQSEYQSQGSSQFPSEPLSNSIVGDITPSDGIPKSEKS